MNGETKRYIFCALFAALGVMLIRVGLHNVRTLTAEESGKARITNQLLGRDNTYRGGAAKFVGISRIVVGIAIIVAAVVTAIYGPPMKR